MTIPIVVAPELTRDGEQDGNSVVNDRSGCSRMRSSHSSGSRVRVPPNFFGICFGLAGLAEAWHVAGSLLGTPSLIPVAINILAATVWVLLTVGYLAQGFGQLLADLRDLVLGPFISVSVIAAMLLATALIPFAIGAARTLVSIFLVLTVLIGGWLTGQWILFDSAEASFHPGYMLPSVAGGFIGAFCAAQVGLHAIAEASFGLGIVSWIVLGSVLLNRLLFRPSLLELLVPTLAIELAPPAVAGIALFALNGRVASSFACALGGYAVLMAVVQLRFLPLYLKLSFSPAFWAFTFSYAAAATDALLWISVKRRAGSVVYASCIVTAITVLVVVILVKTLRLLLRGELFPARSSTSSPHELILCQASDQENQSPATDLEVETSISMEGATHA